MMKKRVGRFTLALAVEGTDSSSRWPRPQPPRPRPCRLLAEQLAA